MHWSMPVTASILLRRHRRESIWLDCCGCAAMSRTVPTRQRKTLRTHAKWSDAGFAFSNALEQVLKVTDLLLQGGGFGMVALDLGDIPAESARRIPLTSWFRFRRAVEPTATVLLLVEQEPCAGTCASLLVRFHPVAIWTSNSSAGSFVSPVRFSEAHKAEQQRKCEKDVLPHTAQNDPVAHAELFRGMRFRAELVRSGVQRKSPQSAEAQFELRTAL